MSAFRRQCPKVQALVCRVLELSRESVRPHEVNDPGLLELALQSLDIADSVDPRLQGIGAAPNRGTEVRLFCRGEYGFCVGPSSLGHREESKPAHVPGLVVLHVAPVFALVVVDPDVAEECGLLLHRPILRCEFLLQPGKAVREIDPLQVVDVGVEEHQDRWLGKVQTLLRHRALVQGPRPCSFPLLHRKWLVRGARIPLQGPIVEQVQAFIEPALHEVETRERSVQMAPK